jgi:polyribonucleotide nucleotidyltransferase
LKVRVEKQIGAMTLILETGFYAKQAAGTVIASYGDTNVLTAVTTGTPRAGIDFFPLTCDYRERAAAAGKFPGGFIKRETRPTTKETLTSRLMDRPIRPLFPAGFIDEVQIQSMVLSSDRQTDPDILAMNAASAALTISSLPFQGPIGSIRLGLIDGQFIVMPSAEQLEESELDLIVSGSKDAILMIEGFARELPEDKMTEAIMAAHAVIRDICEMQLELAQKVGVTKPAYVPAADDGIYDKLMASYKSAYGTAKYTAGKQTRAAAVKAVKAEAKAAIIPEPKADGAPTDGAFNNAWSRFEERVIRDLILSGKRLDGRDYKSLRELVCLVDVLPRVHGSAVFQRGETQALVTIVLGTGKDEQRVDGLMDEYSKKFMLDYNFPPFSVGETKPIRGPGRREIGHGMLAERSLKPVLPAPDVFPYTIRAISDILESNGSSSMASVCGGTLALMAAGVPISNPVAGISTGLVKEDDGRWVLLTDIIGDEDHYGDMDFKIAGTQRGITGIQLDLKIASGINEEIIRGTMAQSREARIEILRSMLGAISRPRAEISDHAPRLLRTTIDPQKIGLLIGPGGKMIRSIQESTGAVIEVDDDGSIIIASDNMESAKAALAKVEALTASVQVGKIYEGRVSSVKDFGAFIEILPGRDGLCHVSELADDFVKNVSDVCKVGDFLHVKVIAIDEQDRIKLSRKVALREMAAATSVPSNA